MIEPHFRLDDLSQVCPFSLRGNNEFIGRSERCETSEDRVTQLRIVAKLVTDNGLYRRKLISQAMGKLLDDTFAEIFRGCQSLRRNLHVCGSIGKRSEEHTSELQSPY